MSGGRRGRGEAGGRALPAGRVRVYAGGAALPPRPACCWLFPSLHLFALNGNSPRVLLFIQSPTL